MRVYHTGIVGWCGVLELPPVHAGWGEVHDLPQDEGGVQEDMSHELYKRYRPKSLERFVGNEETVASLVSLIEREQVPHTVLFSGPSGCGKTTLARILARALNCAPMDLIEMNCSSFRGVDTIREVMGSMKLSPVGGDCRVWILDEVHQMTRDAQNAALKMLEDTPKHVYFFLCTTDPQKLLPTIRSRCTDMPVRLLKDKELESLVARVAQKEEIELSDEVLGDLVGLASGSARAALVLLNKIRDVPEEQCVEAMKVKSEEEREAIELCRALIRKDEWSKVAKILKSLKGEVEQIRWAVMMYARSVMLSSDGKSKTCHQAYTVISAFEAAWYDSKEAGLARACFEATYG